MEEKVIIERVIKVTPNEDLYDFEFYGHPEDGHTGLYMVSATSMEQVEKAVSQGYALIHEM